MKFLRVIAGTAHGTKLKAPPGMATRPTSDRIKEAIFSMIGEKIIGCRVLDLFAGTGALGIEALSRGAEFALFVDLATEKIIRENVLHAKFDLKTQAKIFRRDVFSTIKFLAEQQEKFDVIFCDPPYHQNLSEKFLQLLDANEIAQKILKPSSFVMLEHGGDENFVESLNLKNLTCFKNRRYGKTTQLSFFELTK